MYISIYINICMFTYIFISVYRRYLDEARHVLADGGCGAGRVDSYALIRAHKRRMHLCS